MAIGKMKRSNATEPYWNGKRWIYTPFADGKQKFFSSTIEGEKGKKAVLMKYSKSVGKVEDIRFEKAWEQHLEDRKASLGEKSDSYIKTEYLGRLYLEPRLKLKRVYDITDQDWQNCISLARSEKVEVLAKKSLSNIKNEIMLFCKFTKKNRWIESIPDSLTVPRTAPTIGKQILHPNELKTLLSDSKGNWFINAWRLMVVTGLRPGEVYGLKWDNVTDNVINIVRSINQHGRETNGKNANAVRTLYASGIASAILLDQKHLLNSKGINSEWIFCNEKGCLPSPKTISKYWRQYCLETGIENVSEYGLRHTFVSVTKTTLPESLLKQTVGHSKSMDTLRVYGKALDNDKVQAANIIDGIFSEYKTIAKLLHEEKEKA